MASYPAKVNPTSAQRPPEARDCMWFDGDETTRRWGLNNLPCTASWQFAGAEDLAPQVCSEKCLYYESVRDLDPGDQRPAELIWLSRAKAARRGA